MINYPLSSPGDASSRSPLGSSWPDRELLGIGIFPLSRAHHHRQPEKWTAWPARRGAAQRKDRKSYCPNRKIEHYCAESIIFVQGALDALVSREQQQPAPSLCLRWMLLLQLLLLEQYVAESLTAENPTKSETYRRRRCRREGLRPDGWKNARRWPCTLLLQAERFIGCWSVDPGDAYLCRTHRERRATTTTMYKEIFVFKSQGTRYMPKWKTMGYKSIWVDQIDWVCVYAFIFRICFIDGRMIPSG